MATSGASGNSGGSSTTSSSALTGSSSGTSSTTSSSSPFSARNVLLTAGTGFFLGMFYFYKRKQTLPFKVCYGMMWPTLGGGIMLAVTPSPEQMAERLHHSSAVTAGDLRRQKEANAATVEAMKQLVGKQQS